MEQKQVILQNNEYICDIDVSVEEWKAILTNETLMFSTYKNVLIQFYNEPEHKSTCKALGEKYNKDPQHFNSTVRHFAEAVQKKLNRFEVFGTEGKPTYWIIPMQGKYVGDYFEWTIRPELVQAMEELGMTEIETEYQRFKYLLEYFVAHLEWLTNADENDGAYSVYIKPLIENNEFYKTGKGYNGDNIQKQVKKWSVYENGKICINVQYNQTAGYKAKTNYLNWETTGLNIIAEWIEDNINSLILVDYQEFPKPSQWIDLGMNKSITELGLFDNNEPNDNLKAFFDKFNSLIIEWNKDKQNEKDMEQIKPYIDLLKSCKNLIFTGAPGTGKTYLAKQIAKQMIGVTTDEELEKSEQFAFVQFHPSYDYTDFVEGLRPTKPDGNDNIGFKLENGVFKKFCLSALQNLEDSKKNKEELTEEKIFAQKYEHLIDQIQNGKVDKLPLKTDNMFAEIVGISDNGNIIFKEPNTGSPSSNVVSLERLKKLAKKYKTKEDLCNIKNINTSIREIIGGCNSTWFWSVLNYIYDKYGKQTYTQSIEIVKSKNYIFIIDEINRGEISKIFGELFFSIDPSYRGEKGAVATQYSNMHETKEMFYVPENIYIIGTMNDIDRSVESFDFAMRRRFSWKEITAEQSAENMSLSDTTKTRMKNLNSAISNIHGLNSSYHIGGAYFLDDKGNERNDYDKVWELRLRPLLFEYLRGIPESEADKLDKDLKAAYENDRQ